MLIDKIFQIIKEEEVTITNFSKSIGIGRTTLTTAKNTGTDISCR